MIPTVFIAHGSPMNAIEDNSFTRNWMAFAKRIPKPKAILVISAHWYINGLKILKTENPDTIYDMYGFPKELYEIVYDAPCAIALADQVVDLLQDEPISTTEDWGFDHGNWSVLCRMFPEKNIPVTQLSIDYNFSAKKHFEIGRKLRALRKEGVLILASGNIVHNLHLLDWKMDQGFDWANRFDEHIKQLIMAGLFEEILHYDQVGEDAFLAVPSADHFFPLLYPLGAATPEDPKEVFNDTCCMGSLSMTCYAFGKLA